MHDFKGKEWEKAKTPGIPGIEMLKKTVREMPGIQRINLDIKVGISVIVMILQR